MAEEKVWEKFAQPLRDLADVWNVDIEGDLSAYLTDLQAAALRAATSINFVEAAMLVQNSAHCYSKKVEMLAALVYNVLSHIDEDKKKKTNNTNKEEKEELVGWELSGMNKIMHLPSDLQLLYDFMKASISRRPTRIVMGTCDLLPFEDFDKIEKNFRVNVGELCDSGCLMVTRESHSLAKPNLDMCLDISGIPHNSTNESGFTIPNGDEKKIDNSPRPSLIPPTPPLTPLNQDLNGTPNNVNNPEMLDKPVASPAQEELPNGPSLGDDDDVVDNELIMQDDEEEENTGRRWSTFLGDPFDVSHNIVKPLVKGSTKLTNASNQRNVPILDIIDKKPSPPFVMLLSATSLQNGSLPPNKSQFLNNLFQLDNKLKKPALNVKGESPKVPLELLPKDVDPTQPLDEKTLSEEGFQFNDNVDFDDDDNNNNEVVPSPKDKDAAVPIVSNSPAVANNVSPSSKPIETFESRMDAWLNEITHQTQQYQTEEELALTRRVESWAQKLEPILKLQEQEYEEKPFKLDHYANTILDTFTETDKELEFSKVIVADNYTNDRSVHAARTFLATLQLANNGNLQLRHSDTLASGLCPLLLKLISKERSSSFDQYEPAFSNSSKRLRDDIQPTKTPPKRARRK